MAELARAEVLSGSEADTSAPRRPFVAPAVEQLGRLETSTLLSGGGPP